MGRAEERQHAKECGKLKYLNQRHIPSLILPPSSLVLPEGTYIGTDKLERVLAMSPHCKEADTRKVEIGEKFRFLRETKGLSRRQLAEAIGCSESRIQQLEAGSIALQKLDLQAHRRLL
jgi:DNA-binding XRE family transcriptional regulator